MRVNVTFLSLTAAVGVAALVVAAASLSTARAQGAAVEIRTGQARQQETGFGNGVADAIRAATRAEIAWVAGGEFRDAVLKPGPGPGEALAVLEDPADPLIVVSLSGQTIREALELSLQQYPKPGKAFLHVSGLRVAFAGGQQPGRRLVTIVVQGEPLAADRTYRVAMTRTMASGSFGFFRLWPNGRNQAPETVSVGEALRRAAAASFHAAGDGRMAERPTP